MTAAASSQGFAAALIAARGDGANRQASVLDAFLSRLDTDERVRATQWLHTHAGARALHRTDELVPGEAHVLLGAETGLVAIVVRFVDEAGTRVAVADPWDDEAIRAVVQRLGRTPMLACASGAMLAQWGSTLRRADAAAPAALRADSGADPAELRVVRNVPSFVDDCIHAAFTRGASDLHFESTRSGLMVKLRLNGVMVAHARTADVAQAAEVVSRIKVMAQLDITETRVPQDGRLRASLPAVGAVDMRVSVMPNLFGEGVVLRLLDKAHLRLKDEAITLTSLGFDATRVQALRWLGTLPHGMVLITGPTGSGKTTTVYAMLSETNRVQEKVVTIEDPVEYELDGVLQIPVNEKKGLTFANGLRSILRHDPDRILVGEIRDAETAEIAVQSALTGHQVLTTVHANSIFDVFGRFRHFAIDMHGFVSSLNGVVVQRLVRTLCDRCAQVHAPSAADVAWLRHRAVGDRQMAMRKAVGCPSCHGSGFARRVVIGEVHRVDDSLRDLVTSSAPISHIRRHVETAGQVSLATLAAMLVAQGSTTAEEVDRVVGSAIDH